MKVHNTLRFLWLAACLDRGLAGWAKLATSGVHLVLAVVSIITHSSMIQTGSPEALVDPSASRCDFCRVLIFPTPYFFTLPALTRISTAICLPYSSST